MKRKQQLLFSQLNLKKAKLFGGSLLKKSHAKTARPISAKKTMHVVLRSSHARGRSSFLRATRVKKIESVIYRLAQKFGVKIYRYANSGNHLHLLLLPHSRAAFFGFIRAVSGLIARITLGAERGKSQGLKFWDGRPFSRIVEWGSEYLNLCAYLLQNRLEAVGFVQYQKRLMLSG